MPNYKKRKRRGVFSSPKRVKKSRIQQPQRQEIKMSPYGSRKKKPQSEMRVVTGKKLEQKRRIKIYLPLLAALLVALSVLQIILPAGIIGTVSNSMALLGSGSFPVELVGTDTLDVVPRNNCFFVLTNETVTAFSNSGKKLFTYSHGFENPVIKTSTSRALVFDQGDTKLLVFDFKELLVELELEQTIITAGVSDSGHFAVATRSDKYASAVAVYDKKGEKKLYEWFSAEETVNNVVLSKNGKKMAVSVFKSDVGQYKSRVYLLNFKSATPEHTIEFQNTVVYNLDTTHGSHLAVITANGIKFVKWSKFAATDYNNDYNTAFFRGGKGGYLAVFNRESDKTDNRIAVFSRSGELKYELHYKGIISDIRVYNGHIYCISDTDVFLISDEGDILRSTTCGFGAVKLNVTATNSVAVITDNKIEKLELEQEQKK